MLSSPLRKDVDFRQVCRREKLRLFLRAHFRFEIVGAAFVLLCCLAAVAYVPPSRLAVDTPLQSVYLSETLSLKGWALSSAGVREVDCYLDGQLKGKTVPSGVRQDVAGKFPGYRTRNSGFSLKMRVDTGRLKEGTHRVRVVAVGNDRRTVTRTYTMRFRRAVTTISFPKSGYTCYNDFTVSGWALAASGTRQVNVYVDGAPLGRAKTGCYAPRPARTFRGFPEGKYGGYSYPFSLDGLKSGTHRITVETVGNDGYVQSQKVEIVKATVRMKVETPLPAGAELTDSLHFKGWALGANGIREVQLLMDNRKICAVQTTVLRPDIYKEYTDYQDERCGFSIDLPKFDQGHSGAHTLTVRAVGNDGFTAAESFRVKKEPPAVWIDAVKADPANPSNVLVSGWALNASGVKAVQLFVDEPGGQPATAHTGLPRTDLAQKRGYPSPQTGGFACSVPVDLHAGHTFVARVVGNDGETAEFKSGFYRRYPTTIDQMAASELAAGVVMNGQRCAPTVSDLLKGYLDPQKISQNPDTQYEFVRLFASSPDDFDYVTADLLNTLLNRFGAGGYLAGKGDVFRSAAEKYGINPIYLVSHAAEESGWGKSAIVTASGPVSYYNFYGIGAVDASAVLSGGNMAMSQNWSSVDNAIYGAAQWIREHYFQYDDHQTTLYEMKWNACDLSHQYATDVDWASNISHIMGEFYALCPKNARVVYEYPVYTMP